MDAIVLVEGAQGLMTQVGSFDDFFRLRQLELVRYASLLSGSTALGEDLVQDVFIRVYQRWEEVSRKKGDLLAYVRRSITNEYISHQRRWSTRRVFAAGDDLPETPVSDSPTDPGEDDMWARLQSLSFRPRAALIMRYYQSLTDAEIGEALGCRPGTVRSHISRGLAALRDE